MSQEDRDELGRKGREHLIKDYTIENIINSWDEIITTRVKEYKGEPRIRTKLIAIK